MRAMVLDAPGSAETGPLASREREEPRPGAGELRVRVSACAVCRTDLDLVEGHLEPPKLPLVPGHQIIGVVDQVGARVPRDLIGRRVGIGWMAGTCKACAFCGSGRENLCHAARFTGFHVDGGYGELAVARADFAFPLPETLSDEQAAPLLCAGADGYRALRLAGALGKGRLGVFGFGASAHVAIQVARYAGCEVFVFTRSQRRHEHAHSLGAAWVGAPADTPPVPLDFALVFSPTGKHVSNALQTLTRGGTVVCAGATMSDLPGLPYSVLYQERTVRTASSATREDVRALLELAPRIPVASNVETLPLSRANEALMRVKHAHVSGTLVLKP